jgi:hypothetical protein
MFLFYRIINILILLFRHPLYNIKLYIFLFEIQTVRLMFYIKDYLNHIIYEET